MSQIIETLAPALNRVEIVKQAEIFKGYDFTGDNSHAIITHVDGKKLVVNHCTKSYDLMKNEDVLIPLVNNLSKVFGEDNLSAKVRHEDYKRFFVDIKVMPKDRKLKKDDVLLQYSFNSSYDNRLKWTLGGGLHRVWCDNGCTTPLENSAFSVAIKHKKSNGGNSALNVDEIFEMIENYMVAFPEVQKRLELWKDTPLEIVSKDVIEAFEIITDGTGFPVRRVEDAIAIMNTEKSEIGVYKHNNVWLAYHGLNNVLNHDRQMKMDEKTRRKIDLALVENVNKLVLVA